MKKIIATVLAMVMALALCTTAFADTTPTAVTGTNAKTEVITNENTYVKVVDADASTAPIIKDHYAKFADVDTADKLNTAAYEVYVKSGSDYKLADDATAAKYKTGYYTVNLALYAKAASVTCTDDGYKVDLYQDKDSNYYAKKADVDAFNDANPASAITTSGTKYIGTNFDNAVAYYTLDKAQDVVAAGHALYKTSEVCGKNDAIVYACAICGGKYIVKGSQHADDAVSALVKISYAPVAGDVKTVLNVKGIDVNKAFTPNVSTVMYTLSAGTTTPSTGTTNKPSPKTFDAGIAMYVGMALTSVAGSAVVIGKKKEF